MPKSFTATLNDAMVRRLPGVQKLADNFNRRKARRGKTEVTLGEMELFGSIEISTIRLPRIGLSGHADLQLQQIISRIEKGEDLISLLSFDNCEVSHQPLYSIGSSRCYVEADDKLKKRLFANCKEAVTEILQDLKVRAEQELQRVEEVQKEQELRRQEHQRREVARDLLDLRRLSRGTSRILSEIAMLVADSDMPEEQRLAIENKFRTLIEESSAWNDAVNAAKRELMEEIPMSKFPFPFHMMFEGGPFPRRF